MNSELTIPAPPWFHEVSASLSDLTDWTWSLDRQLSGQLAIRTVRGQKMQTYLRLFDEISAAFQFPHYFGENLAAFDECMSDLSWLPGSGFLLVVQDAPTVLSLEQRDDFAVFLKRLDSIAESWARPIATGESWDRPAKPFHVILHAEANQRQQFLARVRQTGIGFNEKPIP